MIRPRSDPEIFKRIFAYYYGSCSQPRIKRENPRLGFELFECFVVIIITTIILVMKKTNKQTN